MIFFCKTVEVEVTKKFRIRKINITITETEIMELNDGYGDMAFDAIIYYTKGSSNPKLWKYMRGYQLYYKGFLLNFRKS